MGEIILSIFIGSTLAVSGVLMNLILGKEEKQILSEQDKEMPKGQRTSHNEGECL